MGTEVSLVSLEHAGVFAGSKWMLRAPLMEMLLFFLFFAPFFFLFFFFFSSSFSFFQPTFLPGVLKKIL